MDATQLAALQVASTRLATAQTAVQNATNALATAQAAAHTAASANPVINADITTTAAVVTQTQVAVLLANTELEAATAAVNAMMVRQPKPFKPHGQAPHFDLEAEKESFDVWKTQWDLFIALSTIKEVIPIAQQEKYMATLLLSILSPNTLKAVSACLGDATMDSSTLIIKYLEERCNAGKNKRVWRQHFKSCTQRPSLTIDNWLCELREISRKCEFETCCNKCETEQMLDQFLFGLVDKEVQLKLFDIGPGLTLDQAISIARTCEMSKLLAEQLQPSSSVLAIRQKSSYKQKKSAQVTAAAAEAVKSDMAAPKSDSGTDTSTKPECSRCGYELRGGMHNCPAKGQTCNHCNKIGHFISRCESRKAGKPKVIGAISISQVASSAVDTVTISITPDGGEATDVNTLPDTGSMLDAIPSSIYHQQFSDVELCTGVNAETATGTTIKSLGSFAASVDWDAHDGVSRPVTSNIHVLENLTQAVLSKSTQQKLGMIPSEYPHTRVQQVKPFSRPSEEQRATDLAKLISDHPKVFDGVCRTMDCEPVHLNLREGTVPVQVRGCRKVAEPLMEMFKLEIEKQVQQGLIRPVPPEAVTPFISGTVTMAKDSVSGGVRIAVDYRELNKGLIGTKFPANTPFEAVRTIPTGMKFFTMFDGLKGYHMVPLDEESIALTTFSTPFGLYQYTRLPMGICHAGDSFGSRIHAIFGDIRNVATCVEDMCAYAETYQEMLALNKKIIQRADEHNVSFNIKKTTAVFAAEEGDFAGFCLNSEGYRPSPELTRAIAEFPKPTDKTDLRSFYGLCQQVGLFSDKIAEVLSPFSSLLKKHTSFDWLPAHDDAFLAARSILSKVPALAYYDATRPTTLFTDASRLRGLGFVLKQQQPDGEWRMVQAGSRFIVPAESRYAMIELECLGAAWAMMKCKSFLEGLPTFEVVLDHRPLIPILNDYSLDQLDNQRLLRLKLKMSRFCFHARWVPGKENVEADALSRAPVDKPTAKDLLGEGPTRYTARTAVVGMITGSVEETTDNTLDAIKKAAAADPILQKLRETIMAGFPNEKANLPADLRPFWDKRGELAIDEGDGMIVCGARIVIPRSKVKEMLNILLSMHQGASKMRQRARLSVYWPGMDADITNIASSCSSCISHLPSLPAEPLRPHPPATRAFEQVHADLGEDDGRHFLVIVDSFSGWPHVVMFDDKRTNAYRLINATRDFFTSTGAIPIRIWTDNQPFQAAEFQDFLKRFGVAWGSSSPHYAQSNGRAEAEIKTMKSLVTGSKTNGKWDADKMAQALLLFRNAPRCGGGASPAEAVFGHPIRDTLPAHPRSFTKQWQRPGDELKERTEAARERSAAFYNRTAHPLAELSVGDHVLIQDPTSGQWLTAGMVTEAGPNRDYLIQTTNGKVFRRNRRHLLRRVPAMPIQPIPAIDQQQQRTATYAEVTSGRLHPEALTAEEAPATPPPTAHAPQQPQIPAQPIRRSNRNRPPPRYDTNNPASEWTK